MCVCVRVRLSVCVRASWCVCVPSTGILLQLPFPLCTALPFSSVRSVPFGASISTRLDFSSRFPCFSFSSALPAVDVAIAVGRDASSSAGSGRVTAGAAELQLLERFGSLQNCIGYELCLKPVTIFEIIF